MDKNKLFAEMRINGYSVQDMCDKLHISKSAFYRKCNGISEFTRKEIESIVSILGLTSPVEIFFPLKVS